MHLPLCHALAAAQLEVPSPPRNCPPRLRLPPVVGELETAGGGFTAAVNQLCNVATLPGGWAGLEHRFAPPTAFAPTSAKRALQHLCNHRLQASWARALACQISTLATVGMRLLGAHCCIRELKRRSQPCTAPRLRSPTCCARCSPQRAGFAIGNVAAFDMEGEGVVSPGGVGFDINCGARRLPLLLAPAAAAPRCSWLAPGHLTRRLPASPAGVRVLRTNLHERDVTPALRERLADRLFDLIPVGVGEAGAVKCAPAAAVLPAGAAALPSRQPALACGGWQPASAAAKALPCPAAG